MPDFVETQTKRKVRHSTTVYLPRKYNILMQRAMLARAKELHGADGFVGKTSKYINDLIMRDLIASGLFDTNGDPVVDKLENLEAHLENQRRGSF